jgi:hypothetical protein
VERGLTVARGVALLALLACGRTEPYRPAQAVLVPDAGPPEPCGGVPCGANATCTVVAGAAGCRCDEGYALEGDVCAPVAGQLEGLRWELPCLGFSPDFPELICFTRPPFAVSARIRGAPQLRYAIVLRLRGVLETKAYLGGTRAAPTVVKGGAPAGDDWNVYRLEVEAPAAVWHVNAGTSGDYRCIAIDEELEVEARGGATVTLFASPVDDRRSQIRNRDGAGAPLIIDGVPPAPAAFDGQFLQMDVVSVRALP